MGKERSLSSRSPSWGQRGHASSGVRQRGDAVSPGAAVVRSRKAVAGTPAAVVTDSPGAAAHVSLGFLELNQGHQEEARNWFAQAVELDSQSYLANYYYALMMMKDTSNADAPAQAESSLRAAIKINPHFAAAYDALARFYGMRGENLEEAHRLALHAVQLNPGNLQYFLTVAAVLLRMNRADDAVTVAQRALALAKSPDDSAAAESLLANAKEYQQHLAEVKQRQPQVHPAEVEAPRPRTAREEARQAGPQMARDSGRQASENGASPPIDHASAEGTIVAVRCTPSGLMKLTLALPTYELELQARNYHQVDFRAGSSRLVNSGDPCRLIKNLRARVTYKLGEQDAGEILSIELEK